jgi:hypothetical protein
LRPVTISTNDNGGDAVESVEKNDKGKALYELLVRATQGDTKVMSFVRRALKTNAKLVEDLGNLGDIATSAWIKTVTGDNLASAAAIETKLSQLRHELTGLNR